MDYFKELRIAYNDMKNATTSADPTLQYVAMAEDSYSQLTDIQKKLIADYVNGIQITSETTEQEKDNIRKSIISLTQELSKLDDTEVNNALTDLYAIPTDEQSIIEFVDQFRSALEIIKAYCEENGIGIPIAISDSEQSINDLEAQYQRAVDFAKDKFDGYDPTAFFKEHSINTQEEIDAWQEIAQGAKDATEAEEKYIKQSALNNPPPPLANQLTTSKESIDKFQSSVKSAYDAYATLLSSNYSSSELLDSIQTINQAATDMGKTIDWEFIENMDARGMYDSMELLGGAIEYISEEYAKSVLSGAGIDVDSEFGQMLANNIIQAQKAEAEFNGMNTQLDNLQSSYQTLTGILESYNETGYINLDTLQSLLTADENLITMLKAENGQLVLNQEAYENLVAVQLFEFKEKLNSAAAAEIEALAKDKAKEATNNSAKASEDAVAKLDSETQALKRNSEAAGENAITKAIANAEEAGVSEDEIQSILDKYNEIYNATVNNFNGDFDDFMGGTKSASEAGSSAGDAYVEAFEEELKTLDDLRSNGLISEKEYLDRLRLLYERYFKDKAGYEKEFAKYQRQYLDGYKSLYESVFSHASKLIDEQIDSMQDEKDAAVSALEAQKKAAEDSYNAQIKLLEDKKEALQDEIDKIKEANEDRKEAISLQEKERNLAKAENQKNILQYSEDRGFFYTTDTDAIRDARNELEDAKADAEIRVLEKQQDALDKQIDNIQDLLDASNEYWDAQIEQTEKYYDTLIKGMEDYKGKWDSLSGLQEHAQMISLLKELGYTEADLINQNSGALESLMTSYLGILKDMSNGDTGILSGLSMLTGVNMDSITGFLEQTRQNINAISNAFAGEEDGTSVTSAVQKAMDKIGTANSKEENTDSLRATLKDQTDAALNEEDGIPAQTNAWENMSGQVTQASNTVSALRDTLDEMEAHTYNIKLNITGNGSALNLIGSTASLGQTPSGQYQTDSTPSKAEKNGLTSEKRSPATAQKTQAASIMHTPTAASLSAIEAGYIPLAEDDPFMVTQRKVEAYFAENGGITATADLATNAVKQSFEGSHLNLSNINTNVNRSVTQNFKSINLSCPNVTNSSGVEYIQKALGNLSSRALQDAMRAY